MIGFVLLLRFGVPVGGTVCPNHKTEEACAWSIDTRPDYNGSYCIWCCGVACLSGSDNLCEPLNYLGSHPYAWNLRGKHGDLVNSCKIDGDWSAWGPCSTTCGAGKWFRQCDSPKPANGGKDCPGDNSQDCNMKPCPPVDCEWEQWSDWNRLYSKKCAHHALNRSRFRVFKVQPKHRGHPCLGKSIQSESYNVPICEATTADLIPEVPTEKLLGMRKKQCHQECRAQCATDKLCAGLRPRIETVWRDPNWASKWFGTAFNQFLAEVALTDSFTYPAAGTEALKLAHLWLLPKCSNDFHCDFDQSYQKPNVTQEMDNFYHWYLSAAEVDGQSKEGGERKKIPVGGKRMRQEDLKDPNQCVKRCKIWCYEACKCNWGWEFPYSNDEDLGWRHGRPMRYRWIRSEQRGKLSRDTWKCVSSNNVALTVPWDTPFWSMDIYSLCAKKEKQRKLAASGFLLDAPFDFRLTCQQVRDVYSSMCEGSVNCRLDCGRAPEAVITYLYHKGRLRGEYMRSSTKRMELVDNLREGIQKNCRRTCAESHVPHFEKVYPN